MNIIMFYFFIGGTYYSQPYTLQIIKFDSLHIKLSLNLHFTPYITIWLLKLWHVLYFFMNGDILTWNAKCDLIDSLENKW